jgi:hypothetical protein
MFDGSNLSKTGTVSNLRVTRTEENASREAAKFVSPGRKPWVSSEPERSLVGTALRLFRITKKGNGETLRFQTFETRKTCPCKLFHIIRTC